MTRKWMIVLVGMVFACSMIFLITSCQKQVGTEIKEPAKPAEPKSTFDADEEARKQREAAERKTAEELERLRKEKAEKERLRQEELAKLEAEIRAFEARHIYFDFDRAELKPESRDILKAKADWLKAHPNFSVRIEGHCDERGTNEYNIALGERRANAAWKYLNALGISGDQMDTVSYGEERPVDQGHDEAAWSKNRRDQFKLIR